MAAGLYALTNLLVATVGTVMTSPFGSLSMPPDASIDVSAGARPGYVLEVSTRDGASLGTVSSARPVPLAFDALPDTYINAVIAAEDERFLEHAGIDPVGILGAFVDMLRGNLRGGSTITQQMIKNTLVGNDRTFGRKILEAMSAARAQEQLGAREVMRRYLQSAWYGRGLTGAMQAPRIWFGKDWNEISLSEAATLAAMLKGPSLYDPWKNPEITRARRDAILYRMEALGWIGRAELEVALGEPVSAIAPDTHDADRRWERRAAVRDLDERDLVPSVGAARTTIDQDWQALAETALAEAVRARSEVRRPERISAERLAVIRAQEGEMRLPGGLRTGLPSGTPYNSALLMGRDEDGWEILVAGTGLVEGARLSDPHPTYDPEIGDLVPVIRLDQGGDAPAFEIRLPTEIEGAIVIIDPRTGAILASVGGVDGGLTEFDRTRARRQPGSTIKPFLYLAALEAGFLPDSPVEDIEQTWVTEDGVSWRPRNYDHSQSGLIPMYAGLERSSNLAAAYLVNRIGVEALGATAEAAGVYVQTGMNRHVSAALGSSETTLRDLVSGFGALVNDGMPRRPHAIEGIVDAQGLPIPEDFRRPGPIAGRSALSGILGMMHGVIERGTSSVAFRGHPVEIIGKTGTTQDWRDAWFVGVTPHLAIGVWLGRDDNAPLPDRMAGGSAAAPIAARILQEAFSLGLVDADGMTDSGRTSSMEWPPVLHGGALTATGFQLEGATSPAPSPDRGATIAPWSRDQDGSISDFWGGVVIQPQPAPPAYQEENRNGDILRMLR